MITKAELSDLRQVVEKTFTHLAQLLRVEETSDGAGGSIEQWNNIALIPCRIHPINRLATEIKSGETIRDQMLWEIFLPSDVEITENDRLLVNLHEENDILSRGLAAKPPKVLVNITSVHNPKTVKLSTKIYATKV